jgi:hypothetical protein
VALRRRARRARRGHLAGAGGGSSLGTAPGGERHRELTPTRPDAQRPELRQLAERDARLGGVPGGEFVDQPGRSGFPEQHAAVEFYAGNLLSDGGIQESAAGHLYARHRSERSSGSDRGQGWSRGAGGRNRCHRTNGCDWTDSATGVERGGQVETCVWTIVSSIAQAHESPEAHGWPRGRHRA